MAEDALQRLLDEAACTRVLMRYGRAVDWQDRAALDRLFWPDADVDLGFFKGKGAEAVAFLIENGNLSLRRQHITANVVLDIAGDIAHAESAAITHSISGSGPHDLASHVFFGRYLDRLERRQSEWRIASRNYLLHGYRSDPYVEGEFLAAAPKADNFGPDHPLFHHLQKTSAA